MKRETVVTAIVFFSIGCLAGYVGAEYGRSNPPAAVAPAGDGGGGAPTEQASAPGRNPSLPPGHPPIDDAAMVKALQDEAAKNPNDPAPALKLANYLYDQQRFQQAIEWYQKAVALDPKNVNARTDLGTSYFNTGQPQDALREFRKSLEIDPKHEQTLYNSIVVNLEGTHDLAAAQQAWDRLHLLNPNYPGLDRLKQSIDAARGSASDSPRTK